MDTYIIAFGSNMGDSVHTLKEALAEMAKNPYLALRKVSSFYRTKPWGKTDQPDFINGALLAEWDRTPEELMEFLLETEKKFGRVRKIHWGPRTLDLDIIYSKDHEIDTDFLHLPHPYFWARPFVLVPLEEILPEFSFKGEKIHDRIEELDGYKDLIKIE